MNKLFQYITLIGMSLFVISCVEPVDPSAANKSYGDWFVAEYYVNGQTADESTSSSDYIAFDRFTLERDGSFLLEDVNGFLYVGDWTATDASLTLSESDTTSGGTVFQFDIVYQTFQKMHLMQTIESPSAGDIQIRYLMNKNSDGSTY